MVMRNSYDIVHEKHICFSFFIFFIYCVYIFTIYLFIYSLCIYSYSFTTYIHLLYLIYIYYIIYIYFFFIHSANPYHWAPEYILRYWAQFRTPEYLSTHWYYWESAINKTDLSSESMVLTINLNGSQSVICESLVSASPGTCEKCKIWNSQPRPAVSEIWEMGLTNLSFNKPLRWFCCKLNLGTTDPAEKTNIKWSYSW